MCNGTSQSPIDIVTGPTPKPEATPLKFENYDKIRIDQLSNSEEHIVQDKKGDRLENGTVKNNGHTAVSARSIAPSKSSLFSAT